MKSLLYIPYHTFVIFVILLFPSLSTSISQFNPTQCRDNRPSACGNGYFTQNQEYGFACPHMMMLSDDMIEGSKQDGLYPQMIYATAGGGGDGECGKCYQVQLLDGEREWKDDYPFLVLQIINSGFDVMSNQFDVFMGGGGFGYFTSCNSDCSRRYCQGGPCKEGMYDSTFDDWVQAEYNDPNLCYSGGVKWLHDMDIASLFETCHRLSNFQNDSSKSLPTTHSCYRTNEALLHQNFVSSRSTRVQCPSGLYQQTNLHRTDDSHYPYPSPFLELKNECHGDRTQGHYCITTMQDCCKPSCSWSQKVESYNLDGERPCVYTCDKNGNILWE
jgi:hypothetical protein